MHALVITTAARRRAAATAAARLETLAGGAFATVALFAATESSERGFHTALTGRPPASTPRAVAVITDSHMRAWAAAFADGAPAAAFFEEDVVVRAEEEPFFKERLAGAIAEAAAADADVLMLGCFSSPAFSLIVSMFGNMKPPWVAESAPPDGAFTRAPAVALGAHGYILSKNGFKKITERLHGNITAHIDVEMQNLSSRGEILVLAASPRIVFQTSTATRRDQALEAQSSAARSGVDAAEFFAASSTQTTRDFPVALSSFLDGASVDKYLSARYIANHEVYVVSDTLSLTPMYLLLVLLGVAHAVVFSRVITTSLVPLAVAYVLVAGADAAAGAGVQFALGAICLFAAPAIVAASKKAKNGH